MPGKLKLALIGAGGIGARWLEAIAQVPLARLTLAVDTDLNRARAAAARFPGCQALADWRAAVRAPDLQAVLIATPHNLLSPITMGALCAGKHVLAEKPGAVRPLDIRRAVRLAERRKLVYMVGFNHRFHPGFILARRLWQAGRIGEIQFIRARYGFGGRPGMEKEWRLDPAVSGGGELIDQGIHMIDMVRSFLGDCREVAGFAEALYWPSPADDNAFVLMKNQSGRIGSIHVSWSNWDPLHQFEIYGTKGYIKVEGLGRKYGGTEAVVVGLKQRDPRLAPRERRYVCNPDANLSLSRELKEFMSAVRQGRAPVPNGADAYQALTIVKKIYGRR